MRECPGLTGLLTVTPWEPGWGRGGPRGSSSRRSGRHVSKSLKGWVWDPYEAQWEEGFARLQQFVAKHGHTRMPAKHTTPDGFRLGMWVVKQ